MLPAPLKLPRLYAIVDAACFLPSAAGMSGKTPVRKRMESAPLSAALARADDILLRVLGYAKELASAGVTLIQYRDKLGTVREILSHARELRRTLPRSVSFFLNDRADLCVAANCDGVHVGQDDLSPAGARLVVGEQRFVGISTHNAAQFEIAAVAPVDYVAIGPIFATGSKANPDPVVGLDGLQSVRKLTKKPLVAIGGITRDNCRSVIDAGADSVAVIADLLADPRRRAEEFLTLLDR